MIRTVLGVAVLAFGATTLVAQTDPIAARKALMKSNGDQNRVATEMLEGKRPFNLDEAKKVFVVFAEAGEKAPALFPDNSKTGGDTAALPPIWENKADFNAKLAKFASESKAAGDATKDLDTFKVQITEVRKNCGGCHQTYRKRRYSGSLPSRRRCRRARFPRMPPIWKTARPCSTRAAVRPATRSRIRRTRPRSAAGLD